MDYRPNLNWPNLNWKEIHALSEEIAPELEGLFVDRIIVPSRPRFPEGYLKGEWSIRFTGRRRECALLISVRPRHPYFALFESKGPAAAPMATRSPFDLALAKHLNGVKLVKLWALPKERVLLLDFEQELRLVLFLVPATPEALLVRTPQSQAESSWSIIARSRTIRNDPEGSRFFKVPDGSRAPKDCVVRAEFSRSDSIMKQLETWLDQEAFYSRMQAIERTLRDQSKLTEDRIRQTEVSLKEAQGEPDWQHYANLLKAALGTIPEGPAKEREVVDYVSGEKVRIPGDERLSLREQIEKFYQNARRKQRRLTEASSRLQTFQETRNRVDQLLKKLGQLKNAETPSWKNLEALERESGQPPRNEGPQPGGAKKKHGAWLGKSFQSRDKLPIWVGRSKDENLDLTFKHARGNDVWMHVRGKPGAHVVIPVPSGKSVPLETLLDAANLAIHYSHGENWGKTEVDYTLKKYVKRIKDSTEASYTNNKTLIVELDKNRLDRLLSGGSKGSEK